MANGFFRIQRALKRSSLLLLWRGLLGTPGRISQQKIHGDEKEACAVPGSATHLCPRSPETLPRRLRLSFLRTAINQSSSDLVALREAGMLLVHRLAPPPGP